MSGELCPHNKERHQDIMTGNRKRLTTPWHGPQPSALDPSLQPRLHLARGLLPAHAHPKPARMCTHSPAAAASAGGATRLGRGHGHGLVLVVLGAVAADAACAAKGALRLRQQGRAREGRRKGGRVQHARAWLGGRVLRGAAEPHTSHPARWLTLIVCSLDLCHRAVQPIT